MRRAIVAALLLAAAGCNDLATPAELARPQILAVRADPPGLAEGARSELTILVAGPDGTLDADTTWVVAEPTPEVPAIGTIDIDGDGRVWYVPPDVVGMPALTSVQATVQIDGGPDLVALKGIGVGLNNSTENPVVEQVIVGGEALDDGATATIAVGETVSLDVDLSPLPTNDSIVSWYATLGEIELYRRTPTEIVAPEEPGTGTLYVTYRDERGGVDWLSIALVVE